MMLADRYSDVMAQKKLRLGKWVPLGAVSCPRCDQQQASGGVRKVIDHSNHSTRNELMCVSCKQTFDEWYADRSDESDMVIINQ